MMKSQFKFEKGDTVKIVDKWSGISDPAEYKVHNFFTMSSMSGAAINMYEVETDGRHALVQESMLQLVRSRRKMQQEFQAAVTELFDWMDESARQASIDRLLDMRLDRMTDMHMPQSESDKLDIQDEIRRIDEHLARFKGAE